MSETDLFGFLEISVANGLIVFSSKMIRVLNHYFRVVCLAAMGSLLVQEDLGFEHEFGIVRHLILLAEVDLVRFLTAELANKNGQHHHCHYRQKIRKN